MRASDRAACARAEPAEEERPTAISGKPRYLDRVKLGAITAVLGVLLAGAGCTTSPRPLTWRVRFDSAATRDATVSIEAWIARGGCGSEDKAYGPVSIARGEPLPSVPPTLASARYAFLARALDASCHVVATGCAEAQLPQPSGSEVTTVMLAAAGDVACPADVCVAGRCSPFMRDAGPGDDGSSPLDGSPPPVDAASQPTDEQLADLCRRLAELECVGNQTCCSDPARRYTDNEACLADQTSDCDMFLGASSLTDGTIGFDRAHADEILTEVEAAVERCAIVSFTSRDLFSLFVGTLPVGADCAPNTGDAFRALACASPSVCLASDFGATCGAPLNAGDSCRATWECRVGLYCAADRVTGAQTCAALLANGNACATDEACTSDYCRPATPPLCAAPTPDELYCVPMV